jgi:hypothetical protein
MSACRQFGEAQRALDEVRRLLLNPNTVNLHEAAIKLDRAIQIAGQTRPSNSEMIRFAQSAKVVNALIDQGRRFNDLLVSLINPPGEGYTRAGNTASASPASAIVLQG